MVAVTTRAGKGSPLTNAEIDANFTNLKTAVEAAAISANWDSVVGRPTALSSFNNDSGFVTAAGARSAISATGSLSYNPTTGVMSVSVPVTSVFGRTGAVTLGSGDVTTALGYTPPQPGGSGASGTWGISISGSAASVNLGSGSIVSSAWAGTSGYPGYSYSGGNHRFGFSSSSGVIDVYADGNFYATDSAHLVLHAGNYNSYAPTLTGGGASGTWGINITGNAASVSGINASQFFNNMGNNHSTYTDANSIPGFGFYYLQGTANGPGNGNTQWYGMTLGLGNDYAYGSYAMQFAIPRTPLAGNPYPAVRFRENGSWGSWSKIWAGYADTAGSATDSTKLPLSGGTLTGRLTVPNQTVQSTSPTIDFYDTDQGTTRYLHVNGNLMGFLNTGGGWDMYANNSGQVWTANYGWLHDYFFSAVSNCARLGDPSSGWQGASNCTVTDNCYNCGEFAPAGNASWYRMVTLFDSGSTARIGMHGTRYNCNCDCNCC